MKILSASIAVLVTLCAPAIADPAARPDAVKIRFDLTDTTSTRSFDVMVGSTNPCATARDKRADHEIELKACVTDPAHLDVDWFIRGAWGEYHSTSSVPLAHGATTELGSAKGPHLVVTVQ